eukprot:c26947_g1_i1 orf=333-3047(-)
MLVSLSTSLPRSRCAPLGAPMAPHSITCPKQTLSISFLLSQATVATQSRTLARGSQGNTSIGASSVSRHQVSQWSGSSISRAAAAFRSTSPAPKASSLLTHQPLISKALHQVLPYRFMQVRTCSSIGSSHGSDKNLSEVYAAPEIASQSVDEAYISRLRTPCALEKFCPDTEGGDYEKCVEQGWISDKDTPHVEGNNWILQECQGVKSLGGEDQHTQEEELDWLEVQQEVQDVRQEFDAGARQLNGDQGRGEQILHGEAEEAGRQDQEGRAVGNKKIYGVEKHTPPKVVVEFTEAVVMSQITKDDVNKLFNLSQEQQMRYFPEGIPRCLRQEFESSKGNGLLIREQILKLISHVRTMGSNVPWKAIDSDKCVEVMEELCTLTNFGKLGSEATGFKVAEEARSEFNVPITEFSRLGDTREMQNGPARFNEMGEACSEPSSSDVRGMTWNVEHGTTGIDEAVSIQMETSRSDGGGQSLSESTVSDVVVEIPTEPNGCEITEMWNEPSSIMMSELVSFDEASVKPSSFKTTKTWGEAVDFENSRDEIRDMDLGICSCNTRETLDACSFGNSDRMKSESSSFEQIEMMQNECISPLKAEISMTEPSAKLTYNARKRLQRLSQFLNHANLDSRKQIVLDGLPGCGKSVALAMVVLWARAEGWLVVYIPSGREWTQGDYYHKNKLTGFWDTPCQAASMLENVLKSNGTILDGIHCRISDPITLGEGPGMGPLPGPQTVAVQEGSTLKDLIQFGIQTPHAATGVVVRLRKELSLVVEVPVLVAIDEFNSWFTFSKYRESTGQFSQRQIHAKELAMVHAYRDMTCNSPVVVAAFSHSTAVGKLPKQLPGVPYDVKVFFERYNFHEASIMIKYYQSQMKGRVKTGKRLRRMMYVLTNGNANELRDIAILRAGI